MSKNEIEKWLLNEFNNSYVLQGWATATLGRKYSKIVNYNKSSDLAIFELVEKVEENCGSLIILESAIKNQK